MYSGGHAPYYLLTDYSPPAHYSHGGYAVQPGVGFGVYAGPTYAPAVGVYGGPAVGVSPDSSGDGTTDGHHRVPSRTRERAGHCAAGRRCGLPDLLGR